MYLGEVNVLQDNLPGLLKAAECLQIKGLAVAEGNIDPKNNKSSAQENQTPTFTSNTSSNTTSFRDKRNLSSTSFNSFDNDNAAPQPSLKRVRRSDNVTSDTTVISNNDNNAAANKKNIGNRNSLQKNVDESSSFSKESNVFTEFSDTRANIGSVISSSKGTAPASFNSHKKRNITPEVVSNSRHF